MKVTVDSPMSSRVTVYKDNQPVNDCIEAAVTDDFSYAIKYTRPLKVVGDELEKEIVFDIEIGIK